MKRINLLLIVFMISLLSGFILLSWDVSVANSGGYSDWHMGPGMMGNWGMGWFGGIFMIIFWVFLIVGLVFLIKWLIQTTSSGKTDTRMGSKVPLKFSRNAMPEGKSIRRSLRPKSVIW